MRTVYQCLIPALWIVWMIYWFLAAFVAKPVRRRESVASRLSHIIPLCIGIYLLVTPGFAGTGHLLLPRTYAGFWLGTALVVAGLGLAVAARMRLGGNWSGTVTLKQGHSLTRNGPYRFVRHPIYSGILLAVLGGVVTSVEWHGLAGLALIAAAFLRKIRVEERVLTEQFGDDYTRYRQEVPALIPGVI